MAWRIADNVVRGAIDNRLPGIIKGTLYLDGLNTPVSLELEGNCEPDLAGRHLIFRNLMPRAGTDLEGFAPVQCGEPGVMTASNMVRIPTIPDEEVTRRIQERKSIPTCWSESLYLEWFSEAWPNMLAPPTQAGSGTCDVNFVSCAGTCVVSFMNIRRRNRGPLRPTNP